MRVWDALSHAMGTSRRHRIGSREAEQLLTADPHASAYPALSELLAAAAAPPRPDERVGLAAAVAAFEAAGQDARPSAAAVTRRRLFARSVAVGAAIVLFGGTAVAAETGSLPGAAHKLFSAVGVPPPEADPTPSTAVRHVPTATPVPVPTPSSSRRPFLAEPRGLCRAWEARQKNPKKKPMPAESLRVLAAAAGGEERIGAFCAAPHPPGKGKGHNKKKSTG